MAMSKQTWHSITSDTLWNIISLLDATRTLVYAIEENIGEEEEYETEDFSISVGGDPTVAAGLYTFTVEEYGKYLYLKSLEPIDGKYHIDYTNEFKNHTRKFERALSNMPHECKLVHLGEKEDAEFYEPDFHDDIIADFETRLRIFYSDFDPYFANKITKTSPPVSAKLLKIAVQKLQEIVDSEHKKLMNEKQSHSKKVST